MSLPSFHPSRSPDYFGGPTRQCAANAWFGDHFGAALPHGLREQANAMSWESFVATYGPAAGPLRLGLAVVLLAHLIVIGWMWRDFARAGPDPVFGQTGTFLHRAVVWTVSAAFVATALTFGPSLLLTLCM